MGLFRRRQPLPTSDAAAQQLLGDLDWFGSEGIRRGRILEHCISTGLRPWAKERDELYTSALQAYAMSHDSEGLLRVVLTALEEFSELPLTESGAWIAVHTARVACNGNDESLARRAQLEIHRMEPKIRDELALYNVSDNQNFPAAARAMTERWGSLS